MDTWSLNKTMAGVTAVGITAFGAYIPKIRLQRSAIVEANSWFNPGLKRLGRGERAVSNWDEDSITMAVEAARDCLHGQDRESLTGVFLASTSMPFADRQNSVIVKEALNLGDDLATFDVTGSQRAGLSALTQALAMSENSGQPKLCIASEMPKTRPASEAELLRGDGAAALLVGSEQVLAQHLATFNISADFVDHFRNSDKEFDYEWEARWIREEGYGKIVPQAVKGVLEKAKLDPEQIDFFILPATIPGATKSVARTCGIPSEAIADDLGAGAGNCGTAHALLMLAQCLEVAKAGQKILVTGFGSGCDAILFERTALEPASGPVFGVSGCLARRKTESNYVKYLSLAGLLDVERGMRAEIDDKQPLTALWRRRETVLGLVGSRCVETGAVQFPRTDIGVPPNDQATGEWEDYPLAERTARVLTHTEDHLTYTPDPPGFYGMIEFEGGGRMLAEFCDTDENSIEVGREMRMMFRVKAIDERRGFKRYFWKAAPVGERG